MYSRNHWMMGLMTTLLLTWGVGIIEAQGGDLDLNPTAEPNFGTVSLSSGFLPDPFIVTAQSGGQVDAGTQDLGNCYGFVTAAPDFRLTWDGEGDLLRIFFVSLEDATLMVRAPDGEFECNDDFNSLNPAVEFDEAADGDYAIWIGSYNADEMIPGYLMISELSSVPGSIVSPILGESVRLPPASSAGSGLDPALEPSFGLVTLEPGFTDPTTATVLSGGSNDVSAGNPGDGCVGFAATAPDYQIELSEPMDFLRVFFVGDRDTTLIIYGPDDAYYCNDDSFGGTNPTVDFEDAEAGFYSVWVGSFSSGDLSSGTLYVTADSNTDPMTVDVSR